MRQTCKRNVQHALAKQLVGISPNLNYKEQCTMLNFELLWLRGTTATLLFFSSLIFNTNISAPRFRNQTRCSIQNNKLANTIDIAITGIKADFCSQKLFLAEFIVPKVVIVYWLGCMSSVTGSNT